MILNRNNNLRKIPLWHSIGPLALIAWIWWIGPVDILVVLSNTDVKFVVAAVILALLMAIIKGIRWQILLRGFKFELGFSDSIHMYATGMVFSAITPGRVGDMIKIMMLIKRDCSATKAIACNILDRLFDVGFVLLTAYVGMWYFSEYFISQLRITNFFGGTVLVLLIVLVFKRHLVKHLLFKLIPAKYHSAAKESWNEITNGFWKDRISQNVLLVIWTVVFWLVQFYAIYLCGLALSLDVPFIYLSACTAIAMMLSLLPITIAGIGTRDAVFVLLLGHIGVTGQQGIAFSSLVLAVFLANCVIFYVFSRLCSSN